MSSWRIAAAQAAEPAISRIGTEARTGADRLRTRFASSHAFVRSRRPDLRFRLIPYSAREVANASALIVTGLLVLLTR